MLVITNVTPLVSFITFDPFAAGRTANGALVFNVPVDYLVWTAAVADAIDGANQLVNKMPEVKGKELWLTGTLSRRARIELENRGWVVKDRTETQLFSAVESYPDYQKPAERLPSAVVSLNFESVALGIGASWRWSSHLPREGLSIRGLGPESRGCRHFEICRRRQSL